MSAWAGPLPDQDEYVGLALNRTTFDFVVPIFGASTSTEGSADPGRGYFRVTNGGTTSARIQLVATDGDQWKRADAPGVDEYQLLAAEYPIGGTRTTYTNIPANGLVLTNPVAAGGALDFDLQINSPGTTAKGVAVSTVPVLVRAIGPESYLYNAEGDFFYRLGRASLRSLARNEISVPLASGESFADIAKGAMIAADGALVGSQAPTGVSFWQTPGDRRFTYTYRPGYGAARSRHRGGGGRRTFHSVISGQSAPDGTLLQYAGYARTTPYRDNWNSGQTATYIIIVPRPN